MEWRRDGSMEALGSRSLPQHGRQRFSRSLQRARNIRRWMTAGAVLLALLPAMSILVRPDTTAAQVVTTTVAYASAPGDAWTDASGNTGAAMCAYHTWSGGTCSSGPWGQKISNAAWIWKATGTDHPAEHVTFAKVFVVPDDAYDISATIYITADNAYEVSFNGSFVGNDGSMELATAEPEPFSWRSVEPYSIAPIVGENTLVVRVANHEALDSGYNPAGLIYRIDVTYSLGVADTTAPELSVPGSFSVNATGPDGAVVEYTATAIDAVDGAVTPVCQPGSGTLFPIGTTTVSCTATDTSGNGGSASFDVTVLGAAAQLDNLMSLVETYNLHQGITNSLDSKLSNAHQALDAASAGDLEAACGLLNAFINEVYAQADKKLTVQQADTLIAEATRIAAVLGC
jgi:hypothetical protein